MPEIRALENLHRSMQRLGYLKRLIGRVASLSTSSLDNLGHDLIETVTRKVRAPLDDALARYIKQRLYDRAYRTLKAQASAWQTGGQESEPPTLSIELQDLYLADPALPSQTGKLVKTDGSRYPLLGVSLGLIRAGTYSANTRALSLLHFTPEAELQAFIEYKPALNPLCISRHQALLLFYALLENDGEVMAPLWTQLAAGHPASFTDRDAGDRLPEIYRSIVKRHRNRILPADTRDRLLNLEKSADSISRRREMEGYTGGSSREHASRLRVEPYADMGLLRKPDPFKFEYGFSPAGLVWAEALKNVETSEAIGEFLAGQFFSVAAQAWGIEARPTTALEDIIPHLYSAWESIKSPGGYSPIEELALVAGIEALLERQLIIEPAVAREAIIAYQKANPYQVRFTVNRLGALAHAYFLEAPSFALPAASDLPGGSQKAPSP